MAEVPGFRLVANAVAEDLHRVRLSGEIDISNVDSLLQSLVFFNGASVELDVSDLTFIDAAALGALIGVREKLRRQGCDLRVIGAQGIVRRVLELVGPADWIAA
jgi:anti-sigma B factor antagonist